MTVRDIVKNFLQYLSMIVITMLAVTLFCGFISNALTLKNTLKNYYEKSNLTDIICQYSSISASDKNFLKSLSNIDELEYRFYCEGSINQSSAKIYIAESDNKISLPLITKGERGVLVDRHVAQMDSFDVGTEIEVQIEIFGATYSAELGITGLMNFAEAAGMHHSSPIYLDYSVLAAAFPALADVKDILINQALIKTKSPQPLKDAINSHYSGITNPNLIFAYDRSSMESVIALDNEVTQSLKMIYVFPVIFLIVSILVILSTIGPLILRERMNIGTLKGIGMTRRKIFFHYATLGAILCFIGGVFGIILGPLIIPNTLFIKYNIVYTLPARAAIVFSPLWSIVAVLTVCILAVIIGLIVSYKTVKEKPASSMRPLPPKDSFILRKSTKNLNSSKQWTIPVKTASRNIILKPARAIMTIIGVMGCVALLVCSLGIGDTVDNSINLELGGQFKWDIRTGYTQDAELAGFTDQLDQMQDNGRIIGYESYKTFYMSAKGKNIKDVSVYVLPKDPIMTTINPNGKVLISKSVASDLGVKAGDTLSLSAAGGKYELTIDEIIQTSFTKGIFTSDASLFDGNFYTMSIWIKAPNPSPELVDSINAINGTKDAITMTGIRQSVNDKISSISTIKLTMMIFAIALSIVVLYNLSLLNVKERSRDIATMKVLGFSYFQISLSLLYEIMFLVLLSTAFGLLLGFPITYLVLSINKIQVLTFIYKVKPLTYILSAIISIVTALIINLFFTRHIRKINMTESLKSIE